LEKDLPETLICRVHKSWMVAINKIETIEKDSILIHNQEIPVSETYRKHFFELIGR
jgi:two-component system, LytTR family, response regulator